MAKLLVQVLTGALQYAASLWYDRQTRIMAVEERDRRLVARVNTILAERAANDEAMAKNVRDSVHDMPDGHIDSLLRPSTEVHN